MDQSARSDKALTRAASSLRRFRITGGKPFPLGATWDGLGVNFALFSAHAVKVELCLFDDAAKPNSNGYTDEVWHDYALAVRMIRLNDKREITYPLYEDRWEQHLTLRLSSGCSSS